MAAYDQPAESPPLGTVLAGEYELTRFLGAGGMGAVYEARAGSNRVAIKVLLSERAEAADRFRREARIATVLDNPHIVSVLDAGVDPHLGFAFIVMPLLLGLDLQELVNRVGPIHPVVAVRIIRQACDALETAHEAGVIHRDIKPANLFLEHDEVGDVEVRVLDFGVASASAEDDPQLTKTNTLLGTPLYISPEQIANPKSVDRRSDVWGLGVTLYEALSAEVPFEGRNWSRLLIDIAQGNATPLQDVAPWIEPGLAAVVHSALLRDPDQRFPTALVLAEALRPFAAGPDLLAASVLEPMPPELTRNREARAPIPTRWQDVAPDAQTRSFEVTRDADPLLGHHLSGRYKLLRRLGSGGMGTVYEAKTADGNRFAVKVLGPTVADNDEMRRRFVREARAVTTVHSDHVVRVVEADTDPEQQLPYIVMELLRGLDLDAMVERQGALGPEPIARLFVQACRGLAAAHALGFVHRDIKPANLFFSVDPSGHVTVKICDFGIVKQVKPDGKDQSGALTGTRGVIGSPSYMSPEQATSSRDVDSRTDIWSLGISLYCALSGTHPWEQYASVGEIILAICTKPVPHIQDRAPWVPRDLARVVHRALQRNPDDRYPTMGDMESALEQFVGSTLAVRPDDLTAIPEHVRGQTAARCSIPVDSATQAPIPAPAPAPVDRKRVGMLLGVSIAGLLVVGGLLWLTQGFGLGNPEIVPVADSAAPAEVLSAPSTPEHFDVRVEVIPPTAAVTIDGTPLELLDGAVSLSGEPGDTFLVVVTQGKRKLQETVFITKDGRPKPGKLELPAPVMKPRPTQPAKPNVGVRPAEKWR